MREPVRSAPPPPPPGGRPVGSGRRQPPGPIDKRPVLGAIGTSAPAPLRPARAPVARPAPAQPPAARRQGVRPPPKKKPPPRPPPPKFQPAPQDRLPPSYEQVLQEDAAVLAGFGFGASSSTSAAPAGGDLIDFDAAVPAPAVAPAATPITPGWDSGAAWDTPAPSSAPAVSAAPAVTIIRPVKPGGRVRGGSRDRGPAQPQLEGTSVSPPMPSVPPPPPPVLAQLDSVPDVRPPTPPPRPGSSASSCGPDAPQATALYDYPSSETGDLSFKAGELVRLQERVNAEWLRGSCGARHGIFPAAFVTVTVPLPGEAADPPSPEASDGCTAQVLYDFTAQEPQDLSLTAGEQIQVLGRLNEEWGQGCAGGRNGTFPLAFVDVDASLLPVL